MHVRAHVCAHEHMHAYAPIKICAYFSKTIVPFKMTNARRVLCCRAVILQQIFVKTSLFTRSNNQCSQGLVLLFRDAASEHEVWQRKVAEAEFVVPIFFYRCQPMKCKHSQGLVLLFRDAASEREVWQNGPTYQMWLFYLTITCRVSCCWAVMLPQSMRFGSGRWQRQRQKHCKVSTQ